MRGDTPATPVPDRLSKSFGFGSTTDIFIGEELSIWICQFVNLSRYLSFFCFINLSKFLSKFLSNLFLSNLSDWICQIWICQMSVNLKIMSPVTVVKFVVGVPPCKSHMLPLPSSVAAVPVYIIS